MLVPYRGDLRFADLYEKASNQNLLNAESNTNQKTKFLSFKRDSIILIFIVIAGIIFLYDL